MLKEFFEGYTAYGEGIRKFDCPYTGQDAEDWMKGHSKAEEMCKNYILSLKDEMRVQNVIRAE